MIVTGKRRALHLLWLGCILGVVLIAAMVVPLSGPVRLHDPNLNQLTANLQPGQPNNVRWNAMTILGELHERAAPAVPKLVGVLDDQREHRYTRLMAAEALGRIGPKARAAVPTLERAARNGDEYVRDSAQQVLEKLREQTEACSR